MSFFSKLLGGTFESNLKDGNELFAEKAFGDAKLAFERALRKGKQVSDDQRKEINLKIVQCRENLALERIIDAQGFAANGDPFTAIEILEDLIHICENPDILQKAADVRQEIEAAESKKIVDDSKELSESELLAVISGTWSEAQSAEFATFPDTFKDGLLAVHDEQYKTAVEIYTAISNNAEISPRPKYLYIELGKALLGDEQDEAAIEAFQTFLSLTEDDADAQEMRIACMTQMALVLSRMEKKDQAKELLIKATKVNPENYMPYRNLGVFLRKNDQLDGSLKALEKASELMGQMHPDFGVIKEMGFTYLAMDKKKEAEETLFAVIEHDASKGTHHQFDPEAATVLATLYEEKGQLEKASDLYRHLCMGNDVKNYLVYNLEAARLLSLQNADSALIDTYLSSAKELAQSEIQKQQVEDFLAKNTSL